MKSYKDFLAELFDNLIQQNFLGSEAGEFSRKFKTKDGHEYTVYIDHICFIRR